MPKPTIVVIGGGNTEERSGSLDSARHAYEILATEYPTVLLDLNHGGWTLLAGPDDLRIGSPPPTLISSRTGRPIIPDLAFIACHGHPGETGELQGYLELIGIRYSGSRVLASALAQDKYKCKVYLRSALALPMPRQHLFGPKAVGKSDLQAHAIRPPFVIKPNDQGSGIGVISVMREDGVDPALDLVNAVGGHKMVEDLIMGIEVTAGALRRGADHIVFEIAEVVRRKQVGESHYTHTSRRETELIIPARISSDVALRVKRSLIAIGECLDLRGCYRADFIIAEDLPYFLEVNTVPGMSPTSVLVQQAEATGLSRKQLFLCLVEEALAHG